MNTIRLALQALTRKTLAEENRHYRGCGGISAENRGLGFLPAYLDSATGSIHLSRFPNGRRAPIHLLDGLPEQLVLRRDASGKVIALKGSVSTGFVSRVRFGHLRPPVWLVKKEDPLWDAAYRLLAVEHYAAHEAVEWLLGRYPERERWFIGEVVRTIRKGCRIESQPVERVELNDAHLDIVDERLAPDQRSCGLVPRSVVAAIPRSQRRA